MRKVARMASGFALVAVGVAGMILPGPGIPFLIAGLVILARDVPWARRLLDRLPAWMRRRASAPATA